MREPRATPPRGLYDDAIAVALSTASGDPIYYTTNGAQPTATTGTRYEGPVTLKGKPESPVITLRAASVSAAGAISRVATHSYVFPQAVLEQVKPASLPGTWGADNTCCGARPADYAMDPEVLSSAEAHAAARAALRDLPTVVVSFAFDDLWAPNDGLYMHPQQSSITRTPPTRPTRPASVEVVLPDGGDTIQANCGARIQGGSSARDWVSPKLSMRLVFKKRYGPGKLRFKLFEDSDVTRFDTLILDAHIDMTFHDYEESQRKQAQYVRDLFVADLINAAGGLAPHGRFVHLYLSGLYWGLYELHERPDEHFASQYLGGSSKDYDVLKHGDYLVSGEEGSWNELYRRANANESLSDDDARAVKEYLDLPTFVDYMLLNYYVGNEDWPGNNWYAARRRDEGRFRFFSWDAEFSLMKLEADVRGRDWDHRPCRLYNRLWTHPPTRQEIIERADRLYGRGGVLYVNPERPGYDPEAPENNRPAALYMRRIEEVRSSIVLESARWGDSQQETALGVATFDAELRRLLTEYFPKRSAVTRAQLERPVPRRDR